MQTLITTLHVVTCVLLVLVVLIQSGKGAEISSSFAGSSQTVFGSSGGANFFTRFTAGAAVLIMMTSLSLTLMSRQSQKSLFVGADTAGKQADASSDSDAAKTSTESVDSSKAKDAAPTSAVAPNADASSEAPVAAESRVAPTDTQNMPAKRAQESIPKGATTGQH